VEAYYAGVPLVLVTADRPLSHRGTGSPQAIEQLDLFGTYAPTVFDGATADDHLSLAEWHLQQPIHVNVCFDEPLIEAVNEIRAMTVEVLARERAAALPGAAFPPSGLPALRPRAHAADWPKAQKGKNARRRDRL